MLEGLAQRIVRGDVPESMKGKRVIALDLGLLISGAKVSGIKSQSLRRGSRRLNLSMYSFGATSKSD